MVSNPRALAPRLVRAGALVLLFSGCAAELDMAKAYEAKVAPTTIEYRGVKEETRQYGDYGTIHATILKAPPAAAKR